MGAAKLAKMPTPTVLDATETAIMSAGHLYDNARRGQGQGRDGAWHLSLLRTQLEQAILGVDELLERESHLT